MSSVLYQTCRLKNEQNDIEINFKWCPHMSDFESIHFQIEKNF